MVRRPGKGTHVGEAVGAVVLAALFLCTIAKRKQRSP